MSAQGPRLLDLFCCAGGAAVGYHRAGFDVYGVDVVPQRRYPYPFHLGDALDVLRRLIAGEAVAFTDRDGHVEHLRLSDFAVIHASPPCQLYSITRHTHDREHPDLVEPTRVLLITAGLPYVIENVPGAPLVDPLTLCGSEFGLQALDVDGRPLQLRRHRLFESSEWLMGAGGCFHDPAIDVGGAYGGGASDRTDTIGRGGITTDRATRAALLGIEHPMSLHELSQSIPPAFTEHVGRQVLASLAG